MLTICLNKGRASRLYSLGQATKQMTHILPVLGFKTIFSRLSGSNFVLSSKRVFLFQLSFPGIKKVACAEKRLIPLERRVGIRPQNRYSIRDSRSVFGSVGFFPFWPRISHLTISTFPDLLLVFSGHKDINYCLFAGS